MSLGELVDQRITLKQMISESETVTNLLKAELEVHDALIIAAADEAGLTKFSGTKTGKVLGIKERTVPSIKDWSAYYAYIQEKEYFHLLEKRPSVTGCRELWDLGEEIPGCERFTKRVVS